METDNIIQLVFDKIFNQVTSNGSDLLTEPFVDIKSKTFENKFIHQTIKKLTFRSEECVRSYLTHLTYQKKFLFCKLQNELDVDICLGKVVNITKPSDQSLKLAVINNNLEVVKSLYKADSSLLAITAEFGYEEIYEWLRAQGLEPNISVYNKAVQGPSLSIVKDISVRIGLSEETIRLAFEANHTHIIMEVVQMAMDDDISIPPEFVAYAILNENFDLLEKLNILSKIKFYDELFYSAILSGSPKMIKYMESVLPDIHTRFVLDTSPTGRGQSSLLSDEMVYIRNGLKYFSHVMNYAVQSKSLEVVKYIVELGYGITLSNIINALQHSTVEILDYVLYHYRGKLPFYLINYFNLGSYLPSKTEKFHKLISHGFVFNPCGSLSLDDYKYDTAHLSLIRNKKVVQSDLSDFDSDYLLNYSTLFHSVADCDLKQITRVRMSAELGLDMNYDNIPNKQYLIDTIYLFGSGPQIKAIIDTYGCLPSQRILMETLCYGQIGKLSLVIPKLDEPRLKELYQLSQIISDSLVDKFFEMNVQFEPDLRYIIASGKHFKILRFVQEKKPFLSPEIIEEIFSLNDPELIRKLDLASY